jgi:hypothetical protein
LTIKVLLLYQLELCEISENFEEQRFLFAILEEIETISAFLYAREGTLYAKET